MASTALRGHPFAAEIRGLFGVAMAVFVLTVAVGILNGLDLVEFDRNTILTHVHSGAMGWISLSALAATLWLFGGPATAIGAPRVRQLTWLAAISIPFYVIAFWTGNLVFRAVTGIVVMVAIGWWLWWAWSAYRAAPPTVPRLAFLAGILTLTYGSAAASCSRSNTRPSPPSCPSTRPARTWWPWPSRTSSSSGWASWNGG